MNFRSIKDKFYFGKWEMLLQGQNNTNQTRFRLKSELGVEFVNERMQAISLPFWLRLEPIEIVRRHRWIRLRYSSSFFDESVRPLIRFQTADGRKYVQAMNAAILGSVEWIGRVPNEIASISISPGRRLGPFSFRIDEINPISRLELLWRGFRTEPLWALWAIRSRLLNSREEAWQALQYAVGGTDFKQYKMWRARLNRDLDLDGIDRPSADWSTTPNIHLLMSLGTSQIADFYTTINALKAQAYRRWVLHVVIDAGTPAEVSSTVRKEMRADSRLVEHLTNAVHPSLYSYNDWLAVIKVGDTLPNYALAVVAETLAVTPNLALVYSDEDCIGPMGNYHTPILKPDWSPIFNEQAHYVGRLTCVKYADLVATGAAVSDILFNEERTISDIIAKAKPGALGHIRRVLYHRHGKPAQQDPRPKPAATAGVAELRWPDVAIVIPTRDRADLLSECVRGLKEKTEYPSMQVVIVDNGSTQHDALLLLSTLRSDRRFIVLNRPGPFNYSKLSNDGARAANARLLVFMNNDVQMLAPNWLSELVRWAERPEIGAVGPKLLFPDGRIQHAGVVLGMGGISGHLYRRSLATDSGYLQQLNTTREVLAVTGACLAIDREKFEAVGGFDEDRLPIDLNDIDFCLRVAKSGWTNLMGV